MISSRQKTFLIWIHLQARLNMMLFQQNAHLSLVSVYHYYLNTFIVVIQLSDPFK